MAQRAIAESLLERQNCRGGNGNTPSAYVVLSEDRYQGSNSVTDVTSEDDPSTSRSIFEVTSIPLERTIGGIANDGIAIGREATALVGARVIEVASGENALVEFSVVVPPDCA